MFLEQLEVANFRNLAPLVLSFRAPLNIFYGDNAQGKTNLLEAVYLLTALRAFRATRNRELIRWEESEALVRGRIRTGLGEREVDVRLAEGARRVRVDGKSLKSVVDFSGEVKVILFSPEDLSLVRGSPAGRRTYLDRAIYHLYPRYQEIVRDYAQVIAQKNRLLSQAGVAPGLIAVWDERQAELGSKLIVTRSRFVARVQELFRRTFQEISGTPIVASLRYVLAVPELAGVDGAELRRRFMTAIERNADEERRRKVTLVGPHRDDLEITLEGREASTYGSQGQARMLSLCLKIIELEVLLEERGVVPIFLLDDVSSELDEHRNRYLMEYLAQVGCQVFLTTTALSHVPVNAFPQVSTFQVIAGNVLPDLADKPES
jgi:DNA replication and repair protein RecF